jgi:hypothetical protein
LLPLTVKPLNLDTQEHTSALSIGKILQDSTLVEELPSRSQTFSSDAEHLISYIHGLSPRVRAIFDCGALIIELGNQEVVEVWLKMCDEAIVAAVFFDGEELSVIDRGRHKMLLHTSPYARRLESCIVFLDQAHCRGTDLQLSPSCRAAVTIGIGLTGDQLVQACGRLRKLGHGQSLTFIVPNDAALRIRERLGMSDAEEDEDEDSIGATEVVLACITEIWVDNEKKAVP